MVILAPLVTSLKLVLSAIATVGSIIVHHDQETGRDTLNVAPAICWLYGMSIAGCLVSASEPFSSCLESVSSIFQKGIGL